MRLQWSASVVSHGHGAGVLGVLESIHAQLRPVAHELILTLNAGEKPDFVDRLSASARARLRVIRNESPRGFGANHNAALMCSKADHLLIADPDLGMPDPIFDALETALASERTGIVAPLAVTDDGFPEDNGRTLVTPSHVLRRGLLGRRKDRCPTGVGAVQVDWLAGLCLAMRAETFARLRGFDEAYYMYCEDVDLSLRAQALGLDVLLLSDLRVVHPARRQTLRDLRHLRWHLASLLRLWRSPAYRALRRAGSRR